YERRDTEYGCRRDYHDHEQHHRRTRGQDDAARERDDPEDQDDHERVAQACGEGDQPVGDPAIEADRPAHVPEALQRAEEEQERPIDRRAESLAIERARHEHGEREKAPPRGVDRDERLHEAADEDGDGDEGHPLRARERSEDMLLTPYHLRDPGWRRLGSEQREDRRGRTDEAHDARGKRGAEPAGPAEPQAQVRREELDEDEVRREAGEEDAREEPVAREAGEGDRRAAPAAWRIPERLRELRRDRRDRRDACGAL